MITKETKLIFEIDIREAQSLLLLMRMLDDLHRKRGGSLDLRYGLNDGNKQDFTAIRIELERILLMKEDTCITVDT